MIRHILFAFLSNFHHLAFLNWWLLVHLMFPSLLSGLSNTSECLSNSHANYGYFPRDWSLTLHWALRDSNVEFLSTGKLFGGRLEWYIGIKTYLDSVYEFPLMAIYEKPISKWSCFLHHISKRSRTINELEGTDLYFQYYKLYLQ